MNKSAAYAIGAIVTTGVTIGGLAYLRRLRALAPASGASLPPAADEPAQTPTPTPGPNTTPDPNNSPVPDPPPHPSSFPALAWDNLLPLPTAAEVKGDLTRNWGSTPIDIRPLLLLIEEASGIVGAARLLSVGSFRESSWQPDAHRGDEPEEQAERNGSWRAYYNNRARNPPLMHGEAAANFGSGGLFGSLAPYGLWTGVQEMKDKAPLLNSDPRILLLPRVAAFVAAVYLQRLVAHHDIRDHGDIKVGWGSISLLTESGRKSPEYKRIHDRFYEDAKKVGIDLTDIATIPAKLSAAHWPGVARVFERIVVKLPTPRKVVA